MWPTPPSTYGLQSIDLSALTTHWMVPDVRCELPGAFAELKLSLVGVYVPGVTAKAGEADKPSTSIDNAVMIQIRRICLGIPSFGSPIWVNFVYGLMIGAKGAGRLSR